MYGNVGFGMNFITPLVWLMKGVELPALCAAVDGWGEGSW